MVREMVAKQLDHDPNFRWRGEAVTRIENLSDIVFALALGMLVSASSPPVTFNDLNAHLLNIIPVTAGFAIMLSIWNGHFTFFRRYGVADGWIICLNALLLLFVLFVAYPLRFCFDSLFSFVLAAMSNDWTDLQQRGFSYANSSMIIVYFALGYAVIQLIYSMMYAHAYSRADLLALSDSERVITKRSIWAARGDIVVALLVAALAYLTPVGPFAGAFMFLLWPANVIVHTAIKLPEQTKES